MIRFLEDLTRMATATAVEIKRAHEAARQAEALEAIAHSLAAIEATQQIILDHLAPADADRPRRAASRKDDYGKG